MVGILSFRAFQIQQRGEIGVYGRSGTDVLAVIQDDLPGADGGLKQTGRWIFSLKDGDDAVLRRALALPVAPPSGLEDGVRPDSSR